MDEGDSARYKETLRRFLKKWSVMISGGCDIQHDGWPCGTCYLDAIESLGLPKHLKQPMWDLVLAIRGDYDDFDWEEAISEEQMIKEVDEHAGHKV